jgi:hypothetical protein
MEVMVADIRRIASKPDCPDALKQRMTTVRDSLEKNLGLLAQNKSLEELPASVEVIELRGDDIPVVPAPVSEGPPTTQQPPEPDTPPPRGFWAKLRAWLNTPWSVRWRDIDRNR